jgi:type I restriction enzyme S subunit
MTSDEPASAWRTVKLGEISVGGPRNGIYKPKEFHGSGAKIVNMGELFANPRLRSVPMKRVRLTTKEQTNFALQAGDLLFARRSLVAEGAGKCSIVLEVDEPTVFESSIIRVRPDRSESDGRYLFYLFSSPYGKYLLDTILRQVAVSGITGRDLFELEVPLPSLFTQTNVSDALSAMDDSIDLSQQSIETLDAIAQAVFKSWFVDFDPVHAKANGKQPLGMDDETAAMFPSSFADSELGEIPEGWSTRTVESLCSSVENGGTPNRMKSEYWQGGDIPWFKTGELRDGPLIASDEHITKSGLEDSSCRIWGPGTILIALYASPTVGRLGVLEVEGTANQACSALVARPEVGTEFLFHTLLQARPILQTIAAGAAQQNISQRIVRDHVVVVPDLRIIEGFNQLVRPLYQRGVISARKSRTLGEIRDALLPKLLSGEILIPTDKVKVGAG